MVVRGAPAIGCRGRFRRGPVQRVTGKRSRSLAQSRPTAVNLFWALERMKKAKDLEAEARAIFEEDLAANRAMGKLGAALIPERRARHDPLQHRRARDRRLRHRARRDPQRPRSKNISVIANETRPYLQGARLTAWELRAGRHPVHAHHRQHGRASDEPRRGRRGRSSAPTASRPTATSRTRSAPIRSPCWRSATASPSTSPRRSPRSTRRSPTARTSRSRSAPPTRSPATAAARWAPEGVAVRNPAFDVTPAELVTAIISEKGIAYPPYREAIAALLQ